MLSRWISAVLLAGSGASVALAADPDAVSTVVTIDRRDCVQVGAGGDWGSRADWSVQRCPAGHGVDLVYSLGHGFPQIRLDPWLSRGFYEGSGPDDPRFLPFPQKSSWGTIWDDEGKAHVEWRADPPNENASEMEDGWHPYALIVGLSVHLPNEGTSARELVVAKVHSIYSCEIGSVPGRVPNASEVARLIADRTAKAFECGIDEPIRVYRRAVDRTVLPDWVQEAVGELPDL